MDSNKFKIKDRIKSFRFAFAGIVNLLKNEHNSRVHLFVSLCVIILGFKLHVDKFEWLILILCIGLVFVTEILNTSIEKLADVVDPNWNVHIGHVKDYGAAAVLVAAGTSLVIGLVIFVPKVMGLL